MFDFLTELFDDVLDVVVDIADTAFDVASSTVSFTGDLLGEAVDTTVDVVSHVVSGVGDFAEGTFDLSAEVLCALLVPLLFSDNKQEREAAERRYERQVSDYRERSEQSVNDYVQQKKQSYQQHFSWAQQSLNEEQNRLHVVAVQHLREELCFVKESIIQLKSRKTTLKIQRDNCQNDSQKVQITTEIQAIKKLLRPLSDNKKQINHQLDELCQNEYE
jgi:hypothetical protein